MSCLRLFAVLILCCPFPVCAQEILQKIARVEFQGNQRIDSEALRAQLSKSSGDFSREEVSSEIKALYQTGFFDQVSASLDTQQGKRVIVYSLVEKPTVRKVFISGNEEVEEDDLSEIFTFGEGRFLDRNKLNALIRSARSLYQSRGFYDAEFDYEVVPLADNQVDITFEVEEGKRYQIESIRFRGLEALDEDDLLDTIQTKTYKWYSSWLFGTGRLNREMLENDRLLLRQYFLDEGFLDATVSEPAVELKDGEIDIVFDVEEGQRYEVGELSVTGDLIDQSAEKTLEGVQLEPGDVFRASALREDTFRISAKFTDIGYAFANVVPDTRLNRTSATVDVEFSVDKGNLVDVNRIRIRGNQKTYDHVIRRELRINEQEQYSSSKVERSERLLRRLGYFNEVDISTETVEGETDQVDLLVNVREGSTGTFSAGAGFSTGEGALFNVRLSENNVLGQGRRLVVNADLGTERENLSVSLLDPRIDDSFWSGEVSLLSTERVFTDFDRELQGGSLTVGYPLEEFFGEWSEDISFSVQYEYLDINITNVDLEDAAPLVIESRGTSRASGFTPRLVRNTINNPLNPTDGSRQVFAVEVTGLGGNEEYYLIEGQNQIYYPLAQTSAGELVFSWRTRVGYGETFDGDDFPLFRRYFPGGINSVRGFDERTLGPTDENGNEFGGSKQFVNNLELIFPLFSSAGLNGVIFYDVGEAFDDDERIDFGELRQAYGFGIRWTSPLGPIRVELGFPIDREAGEDSSVTLFSFGAPL